MAKQESTKKNEVKKEELTPEVANQAIAAKQEEQEENTDLGKEEPQTDALERKEEKVEDAREGVASEKIEDALEGEVPGPPEDGAMKEEDLQSKLKRLRKKASYLERVLEQSQNDYSAVVASVFLGRSWLGKLLGAIGAENPYAKEEKIKSRKDIPAPADRVELDAEFWGVYRPFSLKDKHLQIIELREKLQALIDEIENMNVFDHGINASIARTQSFINFTNAKLYLGTELAKLKIK